MFHRSISPIWERQGRQVAAILAGSWCSTPSALTIKPDEFAEVTPLLIDSAALVWRRIRNSELAETPAAAELKQAYRMHVLKAAIQERILLQAVNRLRGAGVDPLVVKGWAIARLYPQPGMRPYGDIDLFVRPDEYTTARAALQGFDTSHCDLDLKSGFPRLKDRSEAELYARSQILPLGDTEVRTLGTEDHLRLLCLHLLMHGAYRPLWLCDIAVVLEGRSPDFDWDWFLHGHPRQTDWIICTLGLAHHLLDMRLENTPVAHRAQRLPYWLVPATLREWHIAREKNNRASISACLAKPRKYLPLLWQQRHLHGVSPISATVDVNGPFNNLPRFPFQFAANLLALSKQPRRILEMLQARRRLRRNRQEEAQAPVLPG